MMENDKLESLLIDYIDGQLNETDRKLVEQLLREDENAKKLYDQLDVVIQAMNESKEIEPSPEVAQQFDAFLREEIGKNSNQTKVISLTWFYRVAAAVVLVIIGGGIGYWISQQQKQEAEFTAMKEELERTRQLVMSKLNDEQSASQRILGVQAAYTVEETDHEIVNALIKVMNEDPNSNVRLAAIEALGKFNSDKVRKALVASLSLQTDPVVQIALIQLMVQMKEKGAVKSLEQIIEDDKTLPAVKDEAYSGIFKLT